MKLYIAARYPRKEEMRKAAAKLTIAGHKITASWLDEAHALDVQLDEISPKDLQRMAETDIRDILRADALVFFAEAPTATYPRGGRHVEFGVALALDKPIYVIGEVEENIFHYLPQVVLIPSVEKLLLALRW
jgi:nucleoside 2-deoxyribosyltransferase